MSNTEVVDCHEALRQLWDYLDGELTPGRAELIRQHIESCPMCFPVMQAEKAMLRGLAETRPSAPAPAELKLRIAEALRAAGFAHG